MYRNNFLALIIHIIISFVTFNLFSITSNFAVNVKAETGDLLFKFGSVFAFLLAITLYLLSGRLLTTQKSKISNFFSVSSVSILALCLWLICYINAGGAYLGADVNWIPFIFYITYSLPVISAFNIGAPIIAILFAILPSLLIWISVQIGAKKTQRQ